MIDLAEKNTEEQALKYNKESLMNSRRYADSRDILEVVLEDQKMYTLDDTDKLISNFMRKEIR